MIFSFLIALANGAALSLQQVLNAALGVRVGSMGSSSINHLVGALFGLFLLTCGLGAGHFHFDGNPYLYFMGGFIGVGIVAIANFSILRIGAVLMSILLMSFQLITSSLLDNFGWMGGEPISMSLGRMCGILLLVLGAILVFSKK